MDSKCTHTVKTYFESPHLRHPPKLPNASKRFSAWSTWLCLFALLPAFASAATLQGKVVHIADGDTLTVLVDHEQVKVRLAEIDAPESHQDYGQKAKQALGTLVFGRDVSFANGGKDRYGRSVGRVRLGSLDVNAEMVRTGYAWVYRKYAKDQSLYALEDEARAARRGLWAGHDPVPPWEWRKAKRNSTSLR